MKQIALKILLIAIFCIPGNVFGKGTDEKTAILMVHFGTTFDDTRAKTIDAINQKVAESFPGTKVVEAYTSRIIIKRLKDRNIIKNTPQEALLRLAADGYTHVIIQGSHLLDGIESEVLRQEAELMKPFFSEIKVGKPLLYSIEDCEKVVGILSEIYNLQIRNKEGVVLVGHGTSTPANATYSQIDYMFSANGLQNVKVGTVEGYPSFDNVLAQLKDSKIKKVTLVPFMFVAGDHARNDIDGEWKEQLEQNGFKVSTVLEGLGENPQIQEIYIDHIKDAMNKSINDVKSQKQAYIKDNL